MVCTCYKFIKVIYNTILIMGTDHMVSKAWQYVYEPFNFIINVPQYIKKPVSYSKKNDFGLIYTQM